MNEWMTTVHQRCNFVIATSQNDVTSLAKAPPLSSLKIETNSNWNRMAVEWRSIRSRIVLVTIALTSTRSMVWFFVCRTDNRLGTEDVWRRCRDNAKSVRTGANNYRKPRSGYGPPRPRPRLPESRHDPAVRPSLPRCGRRIKFT